SRGAGLCCVVLVLWRRLLRIARIEIRTLTESYFNRPAVQLAVNVAEISKRYRMAHRRAGDLSNQILRILNLLSIEFDDDVIRLQAGAGGRSRSAALRFHVGNDCA